MNIGIPVEENPLTLNSKIEYLNGLAVKNNEPGFLISEEDQKQILNNQAIVEKATDLDWDYLIQCLRVGINSSYEKFKNGGKDPNQFVNMIGEIIKLKDTLQTIGLERHEK